MVKFALRGSASENHKKYKKHKFTNRGKPKLHSMGNAAHFYCLIDGGSDRMRTETRQRLMTAQTFHFKSTVCLYVTLNIYMLIKHARKTYKNLNTSKCLSSINHNI